ncbi:MAG: type II toxin-antitoxin system RelE/ParE family toxin [Spirochaetes bacterium]|nr:type II toxin-antitoxin system RelE/ParE family toxin [Spirochaetota bacterium]
MAIQSFSDDRTEEFFRKAIIGKGIQWAGVRNIARRKLDMLHYASCLSDLKAPPGNRREPLKRDLKGYHSIRINDQWRIVFIWTEAGPANVRITEYH